MSRSSWTDFRWTDLACLTWVDGRSDKIRVKLALQLAVVALLLHGITRAALANWRYYQFKDAIEQELIWSEHTAIERIHTRIVELAQEYEVPVEADGIDVYREGLKTTVEAPYTEQVRLLPRVYEPMWAFDTNVQVRAVR